MNMVYVFRTPYWALVLFFFAMCTAASANQGAAPYSWSHPEILTTTAIPRVVLQPVDQASLLAEDARKFTETGAGAEKRLRVAMPNRVALNADRDGRWIALADGSRLWLLQLHSEGATDLRLGFARFDVPAGVTLHLTDAAAHRFDGPFSATDASPDHQLWLAPFAGGDIMLELHVPAGVELAAGAIVLGNVGAGYRNVTESGGPGLFGAGVSGACNIDVVCPLGAPYADQIAAVAKYYFEDDGTYLCSGTLMNDTTQDFTPYFLTANHCISTQAAATSMSLIWNYQSPTCGQHGGGSTADTQNGGTTLVAHRTDVDFSLVRLNSSPSPSFNVVYAGWDATGTAPPGSIGIHHPSGWVKAITQNTHTLTTVNSCIATGGSGTHWQTGPYAQGTTERGSSGSAILIPAGDASGGGGRVIGTLSGGDAACSGSVPNTQYDCYGKLSVAFNGSTSSQRLSDWLAPTSDTIFKNGFDAATDAASAPVLTMPSALRPASAQ